MEGEVNVESLTQPKKHLALDTDWVSLMSAVLAFLIFLLLGTGMTWVTLSGRFRVSSATWWTPLFATFLLYVSAKAPDKVVRIGALILAIGPLSEIILWLCRASYQTKLINEVFVRWIDSVLYFAVCGYTLYRVKSKITHV